MRRALRFLLDLGTLLAALLCLGTAAWWGHSLRWVDKWAFCPERGNWVVGGEMARGRTTLWFSRGDDGAFVPRRQWVTDGTVAQHAEQSTLWEPPEHYVFDVAGVWLSRLPWLSRDPRFPARNPYWELSVPLAWPLGLTAAPALLGARRWARRRRAGRAASGLCPACGYDLRATPNRCPECGAVPSTR